MNDDIIFHNFPSSPFSEKVRVILGIKKLAWRSVEVPIMLPKPDLMPLTGGYRRTPVMQIGADIFCDTQIIIRELERRHPEPSVFAQGAGLPFGIGIWTDRAFFMASVPVIFGEIGDHVPDAFKKDREAMSPTGFSVDTMKALAPAMRDQWRAHAALIGDQLADGRTFLLGAQPSAVDAHAHMNLWFMKNAVPAIAASLLREFAAVDAWYARVCAIGHGTPTPMTAAEALAVARDAVPQARSVPDPFEPRGFKPGDHVSVTPDDYARDPVAGDIVFTNAHEIAISRRDAQVGDVVVHFPRAGFVVARL
jgi:glutathione S-transferase